MGIRSFYALTRKARKQRNSTNTRHPVPIGKKSFTQSVKKLKANIVAQATTILQFKNMIRLEYPMFHEELKESEITK